MTDERLERQYESLLHTYGALEKEAMRMATLIEERTKNSDARAADMRGDVDELRRDLLAAITRSEGRLRERIDGFRAEYDKDREQDQARGLSSGQTKAAWIGAASLVSVALIGAISSIVSALTGG